MLMMTASPRCSLSNVPVEVAVGISYRIRDGKLWRMRSHAEPSAALEAVGLVE